MHACIIYISIDAHTHTEDNQETEIALIIRYRERKSMAEALIKQQWASSPDSIQLVPLNSGIPTPAQKPSGRWALWQTRIKPWGVYRMSPAPTISTP